jgi:hypothetical protein
VELTLRRDIWIGDAPLADDGGEVVQYAVLGAGSDSFILRDMRKTGNGTDVVLNELTRRYEVITRAWQISRDSGHTWEDGNYETAEEAVAALPGLLTLRL